MKIKRNFLKKLSSVDEIPVSYTHLPSACLSWDRYSVIGWKEDFQLTYSDGLRIDTIATDIKVTTIQPGIVETDFSQVRFHGDKEDKAANVYQGLEALQAQDIAEAVLYVTKQPRRVQISDMIIMANQQATGFTIHRGE